MNLGMFDERTDVVFQLPHPPISLACFLIVESALCTAWLLMREKPRMPFDLDSADEDGVTQELYERLYDEIFGRGVVPGFDSALFASVRRGPKIRNFDGAHPDKMPDLLVEFVDRPSGVMNSQYGLFIECKPIDAQHSLTVHYCMKGILRFVKGDYAWAMTSALMVGYARSGHQLFPELSDALQTRSAELPNSSPARVCARSKAGVANEIVCITEHARTFNYIETGQAAPLILLRHLCLRRD